MALAAATKIGPYEILAPIGAGGMGEVYRAKDTRLGREVAIKVLPAELSENRDRLTRFEREARAASALNHPNIITIYDIGSADSHTYIAMEFVDGKTLRQILASGPLPLRKALSVVAQVADGLAKAHGSGIIHRDLKPENLMITRDGFAKILDFGLAKLVASEKDSENQGTSLSTETRAGTILGTVAYMSPEQAAGETLDFRTDQFSFGTILYEMITGKHPFRRKTASETMAALLSEDPEPVGSSNPQVPAPVLWIIERCMAKDRHDRYESTRDLARDIQTVRQYFSGVGSSAERSISSIAVPRGRMLFPIIAAALVIVAIASAFLVGSIRGAKTHAQKSEMKTPFILHQITFRRGFVGHARFAVDGQTIIFDARWSGNPSEILFTQIGNPEYRSLGLKGAQLCSVSSKGEMAILQSNTIPPIGTLAQVSFAGGAPRQIAESIKAADWAPDATGLTIIRNLVLQFPVGKPLHKSSSTIISPRFSPKGELIAFLEMRPPGIATVCVVDLNGKVQRLGEADMRPVGLPWGGLAWTPSGGEIWFVAKATRGSGRTLKGVNLSGQQREILPLDGTAGLCDISKDGRVLLTHGSSRSGIIYFSGKEGIQRDLSWLDGSDIADISDDGSTILFTEKGEGGGKLKSSVYLRKLNQEDAVRLGDGVARGLSPDGKWALSYLNDSLILLPTGAGQSKAVISSLPYVTGHWFPDGNRILVVKREPNHRERLYVQEIDSGKTRPVSPEGFFLDPAMQNPVSPDGKWIIASSDDENYVLYSLDDGKRKAIPSLEEDDYPIRWSKDGRSIYVDDGGSIPIRVHQIDLSSGHRSLWKDLTPSEPAGIHYTSVMLTPDATTYAYTYTRTLNDLFLIEELK